MLSLLAVGAMVILIIIIFIVMYPFMWLKSLLTPTPAQPVAQAAIQPAPQTVSQPVLETQPASQPEPQLAPQPANPPAAPAGSKFVGVYTAPKPYDAKGNLALGHTINSGCATACPAKCLASAKGFYPNGRFAVSATGGCRIGPDDQPFDNNGTKTWDDPGAWALYDF